MTTSKTNLSKFILKPSSLSKLTVNFNKALEQVPIPKADIFEIINTDDGTQIDNEGQPKLDDKDQMKLPPADKEFIFGEKLCDRVINIQNKESSDEHSNPIENKDNQKLNDLTTTTEQNEDYCSAKCVLDSENESGTTILKLNCKLYILEQNKANWVERGYGILKIFETFDKKNCKIMMWTDKCFRLILNTKVFETMAIDKANKKSIRFNGYDNGAVRIFLVKATNSNDCDDFYDFLNKKIKNLQSSKDKHDDLSIIFSSECSIKINDNLEKEIMCHLEVIKNSKTIKDTWINIFSIENEEQDYRSLNIEIDLTSIMLNKDSYLFKTTKNEITYFVDITNEEMREKFCNIYNRFDQINEKSNYEKELETNKLKTKREMEYAEEEYEPNEDNHYHKKAKTVDDKDS